MNDKRRVGEKITLYAAIDPGLRLGPHRRNRPRSLGRNKLRERFLFVRWKEPAWFHLGNGQIQGSNR
jgi:hypothetical protein